jgi:membrane-bound lytic murein transglycosylase D
LTFLRPTATNLSVTRTFGSAAVLGLAIVLLSTNATAEPEAGTGNKAGTTSTRKSAPRAESVIRETKSTGTSTGKNVKATASNAKSTTRKAEALPGARKSSSAEASNDIASDPELKALGKAEKALFPWALRGVRSSFSFDESPLQSDKSSDVSPTAAWVKELHLPSTFPNVDGRILTYLDFYRVSPEGKAILRGWARKRGRYEALIAGILAKSGVPTDLVWQSLVESGHNPTIRSPAGAAGLWQFMPETARMYGLTVDRWIDERLDPERSTVAAARVMGDLYQRFGNWELALAAYNMGDAGLMRAIRKYNTNDFWVLSRYEAGLPMETALYVPRIIALTIAMQNPKTFGIDEIEPDPPADFEPATVPAGQLLSGIARSLGVEDEALVALNPQLLMQRTPPSASSERATTRVLVPSGMAEVLRARASRLTGLEADLTVYVAKAGESLDWIAQSKGIAKELLRSINRANSDERFDSGAVVLMPRSTSDVAKAEINDEDRVAVIPPNCDLQPGKRRIFYRVRNGDTLTSIADLFRVNRADLLSYNSIDPSARLQIKMLIQVQVPEKATFAPQLGGTFAEERDVKVLVAGTPEFAEYFEALRGNERIVLLVKERDTLSSIASKYGTTVGNLERINRRSRRDPLIPGESIVVYARRKGTSDRVAASP